jgi:transcriptional regulator with XRE-family HTH domain
MPIVNMRATGAKIKEIMHQNNMHVADIQDACGFNTPQAIFKWFRGDAMPTIDNMVIIADIFGVTINDIVVVDRV